MISIYSVGNEDYEKNGDAVLTPISCEEEEQAGAGWELKMVHPLDPEGRWKLLKKEAVIRAPVHPRVIKNALSGIDADIYTVNESGTALREGDSEPSTVTYPDWSVNPTWALGAKVTYQNNNYELTQWLDPSERDDPPPSNPKWKRIPNTTGGSTVMMELDAGTELIFQENATHTGWIKVMTLFNMTGYIKTNQVTYSRHQSAETLPDRVITEQLFRIYRVNSDSNSREITVNAEHVSYDLAGNLIDELELERVSPAMAVYLIRNAWMLSYRGTIATDLTSEANGTYSGTLTGKGALAGFLDPGIGLISHYRAQLQRDNWDIFIMKNRVENRGFRVQYGVNMKGVQLDRDNSQTINRILPVAKAADGSELRLPEVWVDSPDIGNQAVIRVKKLQIKGQVGKDDGTGTGTNWTEEALLDEMREKAAEEFSVKHADAEKVKLRVDFQMLGDTEEYRQFRGLEQVAMYDRITVKDTQMDIDLQLQVNRIRYDSIRKRYLGIEVGDVFDYDGQTVAGYEIGDGAIYYEKISPAAIKRIISEIPT